MVYNFKGTEKALLGIGVILIVFFQNSGKILEAIKFQQILASLCVKILVILFIKFFLKLYRPQPP